MVPPPSLPIMSPFILEDVLETMIENSIRPIHQTKQPGVVTLAYKEFETHSKLSVQDTGGGFDGSVLPDLFHKPINFPQGHGLGLYIANILITQVFNGYITADNVDGGAIVTLFLPKTHLFKKE